MKKLGEIPSRKAEKETRLVGLCSLLCRSEQQFLQYLFGSCEF